MIWFVDFEASSLLPGSFPIEVAWVSMDGAGESHLIHPAEKWLRSCGWSRESEALHGISLETLMRDGEPVELVARRAADVMAARGTMACSDAPEHDGAWMEKLFAEAGLRRTVRLLDVRQVYGFACRPLLDGLHGIEREHGETQARNVAQEIVARPRRTSFAGRACDTGRWPMRKACGGPGARCGPRWRGMRTKEARGDRNIPAV